MYHPCFSAFLFPFGAPGDGPPCIRQRPFGIAGDWHELPLRVFAPQRGLDCLSKSMGLSLDFGRWGYPGVWLTLPTMALSALTVTCLTVISAVRRRGDDRAVRLTTRPYAAPCPPFADSGIAPRNTQGVTSK